MPTSVLSEILRFAQEVLSFLSGAKDLPEMHEVLRLRLRNLVKIPEQSEGSSVGYLKVVALPS